MEDGESHLRSDQLLAASGKISKGEADGTLEDEVSVEKRAKKKKDKVRSAWISFVGRIVAQVLGAVATITLALSFADRIRTDRDSSPAVATAEAAAVTPPGGPARRTVSDGRLAIAVLPLENFSEDPGQDYLANGLTEELIAKLAKIARLQVVSRTSSTHSKADRRMIPEIARVLGVDIVIEGSIVRSGQRLRVTAQAIDATTDTHLWAASYERPVRNTLAVQDEVTTAIARDLATALLPGTVE